MARDTRPRSAQLLDKVLGTGEISAEQLSAELRMSEQVLEAFRRGEGVMPLERQLYLAVLVQRHVPSLRREGRQLQEQAVAAMAMRRGETAVHDRPPVMHRFWDWP